MGPVAAEAAGLVGGHERQHAVEDRHGGRVDLEGHPLATAISEAWPSRPKPVMSVQACTSRPCSASAAALFSVRIEATASATTASPARAELDGRADDAGADGLGEQQHVPDPGAGVGPHPGRIHRAGHRIPELDLAVAHRMAAEQRHARLAQRIDAALEDQRGSCRCRARLRESRQSPAPSAAARPWRRRRSASSPPRSARRVGVVDDRREEVHRLHQRRARFPRVHTGIVRRPEVDQDAWVGLRRNVAQHVSELACGEFARSTSAAHHLGEALLLARHGGIILGSRGSGLGARGRARVTLVAHRAGLGDPRPRADSVDPEPRAPRPEPRP